jgi:L-iditol 2-dehydrogenase
MRVAVYHNNHDVRIEERPRPNPGAGEVVIRVEASGICGSDVMESYRLPKAPLVLGHEIAGVVAEVGSGSTEYSPGDRVFATHHVPCGECRRCAAGHPSTCDTLRSTHFDPGGFAEFVRVPALQVLRGMLALPDDVSFEAASFIEPLGCVIQAQRYASVGSGRSALVIGSGLAGLLHIQVARRNGAGPIWATDVQEYRLQAASRFGADEAFAAGDDLPERLRAVNDGRLADRVVVCTGAPAALRQAMRCVEPGGTILFFAPTAPGEEVPIPLFDLWRDEITLISSYAASGKDLGTALDLIRDGSVRAMEMITHRLPLQEAERGFALTAAAADSLKVILLPHAAR